MGIRFYCKNFHSSSYYGIQKLQYKISHTFNKCFNIMGFRVIERKDTAKEAKNQMLEYNLFPFLPSGALG